ncbi:MAG: NAD(P)/FAD-dependent oxidoreductase [Deltaproteobacteria bacterium]|nr:NAD(P)/FAD-dependent oxidoreductase [Candidatus Zymogenaceae bacterium]
MELFDVIVVGAGPAGATAARTLGARGLSVLVMERYSFPRSKPCAGWISPWVLELIGVTPDQYANRGTLVSFSSLIVWDGRNVGREVKFDQIKGYGIIRSEFDASLVSLMKNVRFAEDSPVRDITRHTGTVTINGRYRAPVVIGAGGHNCPVARKFGRIRPDERYVTAVVSETRLGRDVINSLTPHPDIPQVIFHDDFTGYGWYFPKGDYLNIGVGTTSAERLTSHRDALMLRLKKGGMLPDRKRYPLNAFTGHAYKLMRISPRRLCSGGILLAGDAAGIAYNMSGEGIGPAVFSGLCAAETILAANGDYSPRSLTDYPRLLYARFGAPYPEKLISALSLIPGFLSPLVRLSAVTSRTTRRHLVARRWFFRD